MIRYGGGLAILVGVYFTSRYSYVLFHSLVEFFAVVVAAGVFAIAWNARGFFWNGCVLVIGMALLPIAVVDMLHTLSYQGLHVFEDYGNDLPTQLWLVARYLQVGAFLTAPLAIRRRGRAELWLAIFASLATLLTLLVFLRAFPTAYVLESGLTTFKVVSEYVVAGLMLVALLLFLRVRRSFERDVTVLLSAAIGITVVSELLFTLYVSPFGPANMGGHLLKLVAFFLIYRAVIVTALRRPYSLLFRELKESEESLRESEAQQRHIADVLQEALLTVPSEIPGLHFGHIYRTATVAGRVGGDFYDIFALPGGGVGLVIGDVSGHGLEAAALTAVSKSTIKAFAMEGRPPSEVLQKTNLVMMTALANPESSRQGFLTAVYAVLEPATGVLHYAGAGHPPALILRASGEVDLLDSGAPAAGVFDEAKYWDRAGHLDRGDVLLLYTDGLTEARLHDELLGEERLAAFLRSVRGVSASVLPDMLYEQLIEDLGYERRDDLAILAVQLA